jgi:hypothetical protein
VTTVDEGSVITLTEHPSSSRFTGWSGDCAGSTATCALTVNTDLSATATFEGGLAEWVAQGASDATGTSVATQVAVAPDGSVYVAGRFLNSDSFGGPFLTTAPGEFDIFLTRYTAGGTWVWSRRLFELSSDEVISGLVTMPNGDVVVSAVFDADFDGGTGAHTPAGGSDTFVGRYRASDGAVVWDRAYGGSGNDSFTVFADTAGDLLLTGSSTSADLDLGFGPTPNTGTADGIVFSLSSDGQTIGWEDHFGGGGTDTATSAAALSGGDWVFAVVVSGNVNIGGHVVAGGTDGIGLARASAADGSIAWAVPLGISGDSVGFNGLGVDSSDRVVFGGSSSVPLSVGGPLISPPGNGVWWGRYTSAGAYDASGLLGGGGVTIGEQLKVDAGGDMLFAAYFTGTVTFGAETFVDQGANADVLAIKAAPGGSIVWARRFTAITDDGEYLFAIAPMPDGGAAIAGRAGYSTSMPFDSAGSVLGYQPAFWARLGP